MNCLFIVFFNCLLKNSHGRRGPQGSSLPLGGAPWGQVLRGALCPHPPLTSLSPPWGTPGWALAHSQIPRRRGGRGFRCFLTGDWRRPHVPLGALPRKGARDRTAVLASSAVRHHTALASLPSLDNSGQSCACGAPQCHRAGH